MWKKKNRSTEKLGDSKRIYRYLKKCFCNDGTSFRIPSKARHHSAKNICFGTRRLNRFVFFFSTAQHRKKHFSEIFLCKRVWSVFFFFFYVCVFYVWSCLFSCFVFFLKRVHCTPILRSKVIVMFYVIFRVIKKQFGPQQYRSRFSIEHFPFRIRFFIIVF